MRTALRWLVRRHSPLRVLPRLDADYAAWLYRFIRSCSAKTATEGLRATLALNERTSGLFEAFERVGGSVELTHAGVLIVFRDRRKLGSALAKSNQNGDVQILSSDETLEAEPLLRGPVAGAIRHHAEHHLRPELLVDALTRSLEERGVEVRSGCAVLEMLREGRSIAGVETERGIVSAETYVLAPGASMRTLARSAGVHVPIEGGRGYSFDFPRDRLPIRSPVYLYDDRVALTPFRESTRVVGLMELGATTRAVRRGALETIHRAGEASFRAWARAAAAGAWSGLRPMTPDGLPLIGKAPGVDNLYLAGGHGMLGVTLSLRTGEAIAELVCAETPHDPALVPFAPDRFSRVHL